MNSAGLINKSRNLIVDVIVRARMLLLPLDPNTNSYYKPFRAQKIQFSRELHKLIKWLTPKADYDAMMSHSVEVSTKKYHEAISKLMVEPEANPPGEAEICNTFICDKMLPHVKDDPELMSQRISKNIFRMTPPLEYPLYVEQ
jgi:hypothetical protein